MGSRYSIETVFNAKDKMSAPVSRMQNRVGKFSRSLNKRLGRANAGFQKMSGAADRFAGRAAIGGAVAGAAMTKLITTGADFQQTMVTAGARFGPNVKQGTAAFKALEDVARKTGKTTEFTASQSAEALNFLAMAGFNATQSVAALPGVVDLATAAGIDLAEATDVATDALGAFGLATKDGEQLGKNLARMNDVIAKTTTTANTTVTDLYEAIKQGAPVAVSAGSDLETFSAMAGKLANAGIKGGMAGTTLKNMFLSLSATTPKGAKALERLGVKTKDSAGNLRDMIEIIGDLNGTLAGEGTADRSATLKAIFGKIPIAGVNVLLKEGKENLQAYRKELIESKGAAQAMAATMRNTVSGSFKSLMSAVEGVQISMFSLSKGGIKDAIDNLTRFVRLNEEIISQKLGDWLNAIVDNFDTIVLVVRRAVGAFIAIKAAGLALAAVTTSVTAMQMAWGLAAGAVTLFRKAMILANIAVLANPLVLLGAAAVAAAVLIYKYWEPLKEFFSNFWENISSGAAMAVNAAKKFGSIFGFSDDENSPFINTSDQGPELGKHAGLGSAVSSPQERIARSIEEKSTHEKATLTVKSEKGATVAVEGNHGRWLDMQNSGAP